MSDERTLDSVLNAGQESHELGQRAPSRHESAEESSPRGDEYEVSQDGSTGETQPPRQPEPLPEVAVMVPHCCRLLRREFDNGELRSGLIIGCGNGDEVVYINRVMPAVKALGFDLQSGFSSLARKMRCVFVADVTKVPLPTDRFDFAAAFHSLEHVSDAESALDKIRR